MLRALASEQSKKRRLKRGKCQLVSEASRKCLLQLQQLLLVGISGLTTAVSSEVEQWSVDAVVRK